MTEYIGSTAPESADDDDDQEESESERPQVAERVSTWGELALGSHEESAETQNDDGAERKTFWDRWGEAANEPEEEVIDLSGEAEPAEVDAADGNDTEPSTGTTELAAELPVDELSAIEQREVVESYGSNRATELAGEQQATIPESPEAAAVAANQLFIDKVDEKLHDESLTADEAIAAAVTETEQAIADQTVPERPVVDTETVAAPPGAEASLADAEDDEDTATTAAAGTAAAAAATTTGGGATPPPSSRTQFGGSPPSGPLPSMRRFMNSQSGNTAPASPNITNEDLEDAERRGSNRGLLLGGVVGYLIGRRRGRIRTERQLLPVQEKLEHRVEELQTSIAENEQRIRTLAAEKMASSSAAEKPVEVLKPVIVAPAEALKPAPVPSAEIIPLTSHEELLPVAAVVEAPKPVEQAPLPPAERLLVPIPEQSAAPRTPELSTSHAENVERMSREEVLRVSERVPIDGTTLRAIYEAHQITEPGLRHILTEFYSGGDVKRALDQEIMVKQTTFERDPRLRDNVSADYGAKQASSGAAPGQAASTQPTGAADAGTSQKASSGDEQTSRSGDMPDQAEHSAQQMERLIVGGWVTLVVVLVIIVIVLWAHRG